MGEPMSPREMPEVVACYDCGRPYGDEHGFPDLVVSHRVWNEHVSPTGDEGGLLCPSCMCKRAHDAGIRTRAFFTSGPFEHDVDQDALEETLDAIMDELADYSKTLTTRGRIRAYLGSFAALLSARPAPEREPARTVEDLKQRVSGAVALDRPPYGASLPSHVLAEMAVRSRPEPVSQPERAPGATEDGKGTVARKGDEGEARPSGRAPGAEPVAINRDAMIWWLATEIEEALHGDIPEDEGPSPESWKAAEAAVRIFALASPPSERAVGRGEALDLMAIERRLDAAFASLPERVRGSAHRTIHDALRDARLMVSALATPSESGTEMEGEQ